MGQWFESIRKRLKINNMYFLQSFFIWIRKNAIRVLFREYPNLLLKSSTISKQSNQNQINFISSTDNFWVSKSMSRKWDFYANSKNINLNIYSNHEVNTFMKDNFKDDLIYEIFKKSNIPVQKIDIFRICCIYKYGGIWLDLKSEVYLDNILKLYKLSDSKGILLYEPRKIEVIKYKKNKPFKSLENVIHNGFFYLPKNSLFLEKILHKVKRDYLYFQDVIFANPKQGIMNLTGPHQFTRSYYELDDNSKPDLVSQEEIGWTFYSKYGEYMSPIRFKRHYSFLKNLKTIDSKKTSKLKTN